MRRFLVAASIVATLGAVAPAPPQDSADVTDFGIGRSIWFSLAAGPSTMSAVEVRWRG